MGNLTRIGFVLGAAALVLTAGCEGCNPPTPEPVVQCSDVTVSFTAPTAATVDSPFDVSIEAKDPNGAAFDFEGAKLTVDNGTPIELAVSGSTATFSGVTAAGGAHTLTATITKGACGPDAEEPSNKTAPATKTVTVSTPCTAKVTGVTFPQDTNGDGKLNSTELPAGTDMQVRVAASCATGVEARVKRDSDVLGVLTDFVSGVATVAVPVTADGTLDLFGELVKAGAALNTTTSNPEALASITIQRTPPVCAITAKLLNGPNDDATLGTDGFQLNATGTTGTSTTAASFSVAGLPTQDVTPVQGTVSAQFTFPATGDNSYAVTLVCTDAVGNTATDTKTVRVDFLAPTVIITAPVAPDGGPAVVVQSPTDVVVTTSAEDGTTACATRIKGATRTAVGCAEVASGSVSIPVSFSLDGVYEVEMQVSDLAGNTATATVTVDVLLTGCGLGFIRPSACPALITASQATNGNYTFQTQSKTSCAGQQVSLSVQPRLADGGVGAISAVGTGAVGGTGAASIQGTVTTGTFLYSASVANIGVDAGVSADVCDVTVDLLGPSITFPSGPVGQRIVINAQQDLAPAIDGAQRLLQFSAQVPTNGRVDVCTTQALDPVTGQSRATTTECGDGYYLLQTGVVSPAPQFTFPEGDYSIKVVVVGGGASVASSAIALLVDVTLPCVLAASRVLPQDTNSDARLNIAELGATPPQLQFALDPSCKDTGLSTLAAVPIRIVEIVNGAETGSFAAPADVTHNTGTTFSANLTQGVSNEKDYKFFVRVTDLAGNANAYTGVTDPALFSVRIDRTAPSCSITSPSAAQTLLGSAQVPSGALGVTVSTESDVGTNGIAVNLAGPTPQSASVSPAAPAYQASTTFTVTGTNSWTVASTCTDIAGNSTAATSRTLTVDLDAPTCALTSPTASAYGINQIQTTMTVGGADGRAVACTTDGTPLSPAFVVVGTQASHLLTYPNGTQTVACSVSDTAGNNCTSTVVGVVVNSTACPLTLTNAVTNLKGTWFNRSNTTLGGGSSGTATVTANTSTCGAGKIVTLVRTGPTAGSATTQTTDASGNVSFANVALANGETWSVSIDNGAGVPTAQTFQVALTAPTALATTINSTSVAGGAALHFVASQNNHNVELGTTGYFADRDGSTAGAQFDVEVTSITNARVFDLDGLVQVLFKGAVIASENVNLDNQTRSFSGLGLSHNDTGALEVRLLDAAGNQWSPISSTATIDVIAPAAPSVTPSLTSARAATVNLQWPPTYDDGTDSASGGNSGYDVRWTTLAVPGITTGIPDSATFFGPSVNQDTVVAWSSAAISHDVNLPPLNTYYVAVRALDEVGNYSTLTVPSAISNWWTPVVLTAPVSSSGFGLSVLSANLNNDSLDDLVVSAPTKAGGGAVYVYYGAAGFTDQASCGAGCQELTPSDTVAGAFGSDLDSTGNIGDVTGEGAKNDLIVSQTYNSGGVGRVVIYFGTTTGTTLSTANAIELRGDASNKIGATARIIKDINGDGLDELAVACPACNVNRGRIYIYKGRPRNGATGSWDVARTATDASTTVKYIPVSQTTADFAIDGPDPVLYTAGNAWGQNRHGLLSVGDINADGVPDVAVPMSRSVINQYRIFSGAAIAASTGAAPLSANTYLLNLSVAAGTVVSTSGFGGSSVSLDLTGATALDLVTTYAAAGGNGRVYVYADPVAMNPGQPAPVAEILGPLTFGTKISAGTINTDARPDLLVGEGLTSDNIAWVVYQQSGVRPFDGTGSSRTIGGTSAEFWISKLDGFLISGNHGTALGYSNTIGNVDGQNGADVILGDYVLGQVRIWR